MRIEQIGNATLYCGDCLEILPEISGADAVVTDPPYGCTRNTWDCVVDLEQFWRVLLPVAKRNAAFCVFSQMPFTVELVNSNRRMFRYDLVYCKNLPTGFLNANKMPLRSHELLCVFYRALPTYNPQRWYRWDRTSYRDGKTASALTKNYGEFKPIRAGRKDFSRMPTSVFRGEAETDFYKKTPYLRHPTQKPLWIMDKLIKSYTNPDDTILDPFMGSGSTGVAAINADRNFIGIEKQLKYFDAACFRLDAALKKMSGPNQMFLSHCGAE